MVIVTITKNSSKTISDTIRSLENQTYKNIKWVIIDENSEDNTLKIIKASKLKKEIIKTNKKGIFVCYNAIIKILKKKRYLNDIIFFLHSDDILFNNNTLLNISNIFKSHKIFALCGNVVFFKKNKNNIFRKWISNYPKKQIKIKGQLYKFSNFYKRDFLFGWSFPHTSFFFHTKIINQIPYYDHKLKTSSDYGWTIKILLKNQFNIYYLNKNIIRMRAGGTSTNFKNLILQSVNDFKIIKKIFYNNFFDYFYCLVILFFKKFAKLKQFL